ncbi:MAG: hypothetical protein A3I77_07450 [Gammaproteobacteria bacterium RIFCSPLOWO2_02_FULL_42_14]|nr:MAG: hypothetical protein A3B71_03280 [Gammaproteobacteria bacterium RIFCSPHIGHO2_02_FULL_42_43]OGT27741.1 MAG: hypothetical protein A2624_06175 [Gammaproteobacteria bacterium RIFCSPHIGHO2_01_FULL_42_8]OGT53039.1 MAG: hypothetical protein A3E54_08245 [Gammaproteobacteria bacterium RIFCSPHIGHO2_12_FULL_41_25]OGT61188.1 MAG: hypothetical protein A3I77_07450 [Gammaproteobacteria bacterium RIFCSPLOWO2_02_FULL_42_14]OGT87115.1 MAG: hypothetical protein A3G86_01170 [Gammaproteobacteria bacterium R
MKPTLSVIIVAKNAEKTIEKCLSSVVFADEIIVFDSGSTDNTVTLCQRYTKHVTQTDWPGHGIQRNRALEKATGDWVFSIDADEWVDDVLKNEIICTIHNPSALVFSLRRRNRYCGQWMRFGDVGKDTVTRLFKRGIAKYNDDIVHEKLLTTEKKMRLKNYLLHDTYTSIEALLDRMNRYSSESALMRFQRGKKTNVFAAAISAAWIFLRAYILRWGFLDGKMGYVVAATAAHSSFYRHVKLICLCSVTQLALDAAQASEPKECTSEYMTSANELATKYKAK